MKKLTVLSIIATGLLLTACGGSANGSADDTASAQTGTDNSRPNGAADTASVQIEKDIGAQERERDGKCGISKCGAASHPIPEDE